MKPVLEKTCLFCANNFTYQYRERHTRKFCSVSCSRKANPKKITDPKIIFERNILKNEKSDCWIYPKLIMKGYGHLYVDGKKYPAHRFSYEINIGNIPENYLSPYPIQVPRELQEKLNPTLFG